MRRALPALGLILALSACDGGGDPVQQALRDAAAANHASTVREGTTSGADRVATGRADPVHADWEGRPTQGDYAFRAAERAMHAKMAAASGATVDEAYIAKMVEHHRGAVAMAEIALAQSSDPEIRRMARLVKDARTREIAEMEAWGPSTPPPP